MNAAQLSADNQKLRDANHNLIQVLKRDGGMGDDEIQKVMGMPIVEASGVKAGGRIEKVVARETDPAMQNQLSLELTGMRKSLQTLQEKLEESDEKLQATGRENESLRNAASAREARISELDGRLSALQNELDEAKAKLAAASKPAAAQPAAQPTAAQPAAAPVVPATSST